MFYKKVGNNYLLILALSFFGVSLYIHKNNPKPQIQIPKQESAKNIHQDFLRFIAIGNKRLISNLLWIQTLLESDQDKYQPRDFSNWMYLRFKNISELEPKFYENYLWGGMYLSIIKDDIEGAADIYERGLKYYPNDYRLNFNAGFNYYFEMGDFKSGLSKLEKIENLNETPSAIKFIINKLRFSQSHDYESALKFLEFSYNNTKDDVLRKKLYGDIYALKAEKDLECLNSNKDNCSQTDLEGNRYLYKNLKWESPKKFKPYRVHLKTKKPEK